MFFCHLDLLLFGLVAPANADWQSGYFREVRISPTRKVDFEDFGVISSGGYILLFFEQSFFCFQNQTIQLVLTCPMIDQIECCLELGADAAAVAKDGSSPLSNPELDSNGWNLLIEHGADPGKLPGGAEGLLCRMLEGLPNRLGHPIFEHIRDYHLDPDKKRNGKTLLHYAAIAARSGAWYIGLVRDLLELGADPFIRDDDGHLALDYADAESEIRKMIRAAMKSRSKK